MNDFSEIDPSTFEGLRRRNLLKLLELISSLRDPSLEYLRRQYEDYATDFELTRDCLMKIGLIDQNGEQLQLKPKLKKLSFDDVNTPTEVLLIILRQRSAQKVVHEYLRQFERTDDERIVFKSINDGTPPKNRGIRDFLMEFNVVTFDPNEIEHVLNTEYYRYYTAAHQRGRTVSPKNLNRNLEQKQDVGSRAELAVMKYETDRIGGVDAAWVNHIALTDTAAGYDIESVASADNTTVPRYIEVKAVPAATFRFYWTTNEIKMAQALRDLYYLYLVPVANDEVDMDQLKIVCNPCEEVLHNDGKWHIEENVLRCQLSTETVE